jgi:hypothetical protein
MKIGKLGAFNPKFKQRMTQEQKNRQAARGVGILRNIRPQFNNLSNALNNSPTKPPASLGMGIIPKNDPMASSAQAQPAAPMSTQASSVQQQNQQPQQSTEAQLTQQNASQENKLPQPLNQTQNSIPSPMVPPNQPPQSIGPAEQEEQLKNQLIQQNETQNVQKIRPTIRPAIPKVRF